MLTHGSLFSGVGGFDLGFERAGIPTSWQVEIDKYASKVLEKNFPEARRYSDILEVGAGRRDGGLGAVDIVSAGFPCQDVSAAGKGRGIEKGTRSSLWREVIRLCDEVRPRYIVLENVGRLTGGGMLGTVLAALRQRGRAAEWHVFRADDFSLPHRRERVFVVSYPEELVNRERGLVFQNWLDCKRAPGELADTAGVRCVPRPARNGMAAGAPQEDAQGEPWGHVRLYCGRSGRTFAAPELVFEPVAHGLPTELARWSVCGNAVVPAIAGYVARCILGFDSRVPDSAHRHAPHLVPRRIAQASTGRHADAKS